MAISTVEMRVLTNLLAFFKINYFAFIKFGFKDTAFIEVLCVKDSYVHVQWKCFLLLSGSTNELYPIGRKSCSSHLL